MRYKQMQDWQSNIKYQIQGFYHKNHRVFKRICKIKGFQENMQNQGFSVFCEINYSRKKKYCKLCFLKVFFKLDLKQTYTYMKKIFSNFYFSVSLYKLKQT